jgi:Zn-finger in ubiquitin-hydrolases and other protein
MGCCRCEVKFVEESDMTNDDEINPTVPPSGTGCVECLATDGWWLHLRRCAQCGHVGCCDSSPSQHASTHAENAGHPVVQSFEPGEEWFWNYATSEPSDGPALQPPEHHPFDQPVPGPKGHVPPDWQAHLH